MAMRSLALIGLACLAVGAGVGAFVFPQQLGQSLEPLPQVQEVSVSTRLFEGDQQLRMTPTVSASQSLVSPANGRVTKLECSAGEQWKTGDALFHVDGQPVVGLHTTEPYWRDLEIGAKGSDVKQLQQALTELKYNVSESGTFDRSTSAAVSKLLQDHGGKATKTFSLSSFLWLPNPSQTISACNITVGQTISAETEVAIAGGTLESIAVELPTDTEFARLVHMGDMSIALPESGAITDGSFLQAVAQSPQFSQWQEDPARPVTLTSTYDQAIDVSVIPPAAVIGTSGTDQACVATPAGNRWVTVVGSELGQTFVQGDLPATVTVGNPEGVACE